MNTTENKKEVLHKEIDIIQNCINRMASNSFLIKGFFITIILGFITFGYEKIDFIILMIISLLITFFCWISDAFFLQLERKYKEKYNWVIKNRDSNSTFLYNLDPNETGMWINNNSIQTRFRKVFFSKTLIFLYGIVAFILIISMLIYLYKHIIVINLEISVIKK